MDAWTLYIAYIIDWAINHKDTKYEGMSPACYDEWCNNEYEGIKKTNFDRITESVESLAKMIVQMSLNGDFVPCFYAPDGTEFIMDEERAIQYTIEWLQEEAE